MTREEAEAANVVLRWMFSKKPHNEPDELAAAAATLAAGAHARLRSGVSRRQILEWSAWPRPAKKSR